MLSSCWFKDITKLTFINPGHIFIYNSSLCLHIKHKQGHKDAITYWIFTNIIADQINFPQKHSIISIEFYFIGSVFGTQSLAFNCNLLYNLHFPPLWTHQIPSKTWFFSGNEWGGYINFFIFHFFFSIFLGEL